MIFPAKRVAVLPRRFPIGMLMADGYAPAWWMDFANRRYYYNRQHATAEQIIAALGGTYSRASAASYFNSSGVLTQAASGELRYDYDPVTLAPKGILLEGARTNLYLQSNGFNTGSWARFNSSLISASGTAPDGTSTAYKFCGTTGNTNWRLQQSASLTTGNSYVYSIFVKKAEYSNLKVTRIDTNITSFTHSFNLNAGTASGGGLIRDIGNGWYRCYGVISCVGTASTGVIYTVDTVDAGDGSSGLLVFGAQLEAGAFASSYIPTTSSNATRAADSLTFPTSPWFNASAGTFFAELDTFNSNSLGGRILANTGNQNTIIHETVGGTLGSHNGSVTLYKSAILNIAAINKTILAYSSGGRAITAAGASPATDANLLQAISGDIKIGGDSNAADAYYGHIRKVGYWPFRVTDSELQRLTA